MNVVRGMNGKKLHLSRDGRTTVCGLPATKALNEYGWEPSLIEFMNADYEPITSDEGRCGSCTMAAAKLLYRTA